ncbi:hypothetical protein LXL04_009930 [Taraxacum kok-saghyz]
MVVLRSCKFADHTLSSNSNRISRIFFKNSFSSTNAQTSSVQNHDALYKRISLSAIMQKTSVVPIIEQWVQEGKDIVVDELKSMIKIYRNHNRYSQALQLSEWMTNRSYLDQSSGNLAIHLDLISRVHSLEQAEKFFDSIPDSKKNFKVYGTLLNCYTFKNSLTKAEATMEKMIQLGFMTTHSYHSMLTLYTKTQNYKKLVKLIDQMEKSCIRYHRQTYYILLTAYASFDIKSMTNLLGYMETSPNLSPDWHVYIIAAKGYLKFNQVEKTLEMLKKSEENIHQNTNWFAYEIFLTMYASLGKKDDVYRIWDLYKKTWRKVNNKGYHHMVSSLVKLDDINGAEKIMKEWESVTPWFDFWVVNVLVNGYSKKGDWKKAEDYVERLVGEGKQPPRSTWDSLSTTFSKHGEMEKAVNAMRKAIMCNDDNWKLNENSLMKCVMYLKEKGEMEVAKEFLKGCRDMKVVSDGGVEVLNLVNLI